MEYLTKLFKITIIGGGSYLWGPGFIRDIATSPDLAGSTLVLHDIDLQALDLVYSFGEKLITDFNLPITLQKTLDLDEALQDTNAVVLTITTGGLEAMRHDLEIPQRYGIYQSVGDTVGPGGLARALRNIPVVVEIAHRMERHCPDAWLINYTNPMTTLCRAITRQTRILTVGLCHELNGVLDMLKLVFGCHSEDVTVRAGGINHLVWILNLSVRGEDAFPALGEIAKGILHGRFPVEIEEALRNRWEASTSMIDRALVKSTLFQIYGALPAAGDRHLAEFFPYFLTEQAGWGKRYGVELTSVEERYTWRMRYENFIRSALSGEIDLSGYVKDRSGEAAEEILAAIAKHGSYTGIMNLPNQGQISSLPVDAVVETFGLIDENGAHGITVGEIPSSLSTILSRHVNNQEMIVEAALNGDRNLALQALANDPLVHDIDSVPRLLAEMLTANRQFLPLFFQ